MENKKTAKRMRTFLASIAGLALAGGAVFAVGANQPQQIETVDDTITTISGTDNVINLADAEDNAPTSDTGQSTAIVLSGDIQLDVAFIEDNFEIAENDAETIASLPEEQRQEALISAISDNPAFDIHENADGATIISRPFLLKRIAIPGHDASLDTGNAKEAIYNEEVDAYYLTYETMEDTARAYDKFIADGIEDVIVDIPVQACGGSDLYDGWGIGAGYMNLSAAEDALDALEDQNPVTVAVLDSGARSTHQIFTGVTFDSASGSFIGAGDNSTTVVSSDYADGNGHGTHVSGILASATPDSVSILELKVLDDQGNGSLLDVLSALQYAYKKGAKVVNISLGANLSDNADGKVPEQYKATVNYFDDILGSLRSNGVNIVAASSNDGHNMDLHYTYPAVSEYVVSVGAINSSNEHFDHSNYGRSLDFAAPGSSINGASHTGDTSTATMSGTSMAAPHVSAFIADLLSIYPNLTPDEIVEKMKDASRDLGDLGRDDYFGYGEPQFDMTWLNIEDPDPTTPDDPGDDPVKTSILNGAYYAAGLNSSYEYTGSAITPEVEIFTIKRINNWESEKVYLTKNEDFTLSYHNNINPGVATVIINGTGKYTGTARLLFNVNRTNTEPRNPYEGW